MKPLTRCCSAIWRRSALTVALTLACATAMAAPFPTKDTPAARDIGPSTLSQVTFTVALKNRHLPELRRLIEEQHTPGHARFRQFLTPAQFDAQFGPETEAAQKAAAYFIQAGMTVRRRGLLLDIAGSPKAIKAALGVELRDFEVSAHGKSGAYRFHAPSGEPAIKRQDVSDQIAGIVGLDNRPTLAPNMSRPAPSLQQGTTAARTLAGSHNPPGQLTVADVASHYNVTPLYDAGYHGEGRTIGIVTLASFTPSDAFTYWNEVGLTTDPNRIRVVDVDGGPGRISDQGGSPETTLDVQQAGGMAPAANILVYQAPNNFRSFVDAFHAAIHDNVADTISVSWGTFEGVYGERKLNTKAGKFSVLNILNAMFMQAAAQGQTLIAAQGDAGAYEINRRNQPPDFTPTLTVGGPASSPYITSAGGTTLPGKQRYIVAGKRYVIDIPTEQAWSTTYMIDMTLAAGSNPYDFGIWGAGTGGGVSSYFPVPAYQKRLGGMALTEPNQVFVELDVDPPEVIGSLPGGYAGRNVPDVSLNADPNTGYSLNYTDQDGHYGVETFGGGTSFVAPQLNGIASLLVQKLGSRIGMLNFPLYELARRPAAYGQPQSPFNDITAGDNWNYRGKPGYDQATGIGTLNVANFADELQALANEH